MRRSQGELRKSLPPSAIENEREDQHLDLLIRHTLRNWLISLETPPNIRTSIFQSSEKDLSTFRYKELKMWRNDWNLLYHMQYEHHLELIREADLSRLIQTTNKVVVKRPALYKRLFLWLGRQMIALGTNLLKRFGPVPCDLTTSTTFD